MKRTIRRTASGISVSYSDHGFSNNLTGTDFAWEENNGSLRLWIDLSGNLRVRNKNANCYDDVYDLANNHAKLKSVQLDEPVAGKVVELVKKFPTARCNLQLQIGSKGTFDYTVERFSQSPGTLFLYVREDLGA